MVTISGYPMSKALMSPQFPTQLRN